ncbi:MAG: hypothetical protein P8X63_04525 [Desulfuromonadaceae bacterium]
MAQDLTEKQRALVHIITLLCGFLGALLILFEQKRFWGADFQSSNVSNLLVGVVGGLCLLGLIRNIRVWRRIRQAERVGERDDA